MARRPGQPTRERRLQAISAWLGKPAALAAEQAAGETVQRIRTFSQATPDDLLAALDLLAGVAGAGIVVHGPRGCAAALAAAAGPWGVTGLDQRDTIMGSEGAVSRAVLSLHRRHRPGAIFVVATPVVAINSDDARTAAGLVRMLDNVNASTALGTLEFMDRMAKFATTDRTCRVAGPGALPGLEPVDGVQDDDDRAWALKRELEGRG